MSNGIEFAVTNYRVVTVLSVGRETGGSLTLPLYPYLDTVTPELMEAGRRTTLTGSQPRARADPPFDPNAGRPGVASRQSNDRASEI